MCACVFVLACDSVPMSVFSSPLIPSSAVISEQLVVD